jgi:nucleotide-binding universal stress UspA family protein
MQTVLVPVDGSPSGQRAVEWIGQELGHQTRAHVHLVNVQPAMGAWEVTSHLGSREIAQWQAATSAGVLDPAAKQLLAAGVAVTTHARVGDVATTIADCARDLRCDAIAMGTRGLGAVQSLLLGSTALKVIHLADVPVALIK